MSHVNVSSTWKNLVSGTAVNVSSAWKAVSEIHVNVGGVWKLGWKALVIALSDTSNIVSNGTAGDGNRALVGLKVLRNGQVQEASGDTGSPLSYSLRENWGDPNATDLGDSYHVRVTNDGETGAAGTDSGTFGSWLALTSDRTWTWEKATDVSGTATLNVTLAISDDGGSTILDSVSFDMIASESL